MDTSPFAKICYIQKAGIEFFIHLSNIWVFIMGTAFSPESVGHSDESDIDPVTVDLVLQ